jgi:hypothetical protein
MEKKNIPTPYEAEMYTTRTVFMVENSPSSGIYHEVLIPHEVANQLRDVIAKFYTKPGKEGFALAISSEVVKIPFAKGEYSTEEIESSLKAEES